MQCNEVTVHCFVVLTFANLQRKQWVGITCFRRAIISFTYSYGSYETPKMRISTSKYITLNQHDTVYSIADENVNLNILNVYFLNISNFKFKFASMQNKILLNTRRKEQTKV